MGVYSFATDGAIKGLMKRLVAICAGLIGIAVLWFVIILAFVALMTRLMRPRDRLEF